MTTAQPASTHNIVELNDVFRPSRSLGQEAWSRLIRNKASVIGMFIIGFFILLAAFASVIAPIDPLELHAGKRFLPPPFYTNGQTNIKPESRFLLGTDSLGRDVLSRVIYGSRVSMVVGFLPTAVIILLGTTIGMISGYVGGRLDNLLMRLTDVIYAFPDLLFFIIVMVALRDTFLGQLLNGLILLFAALAIVNWVGVARLVRGQVLSLKQKEFVEAARCIGVKDVRIMFRHILPIVYIPGGTKTPRLVGVESQIAVMPNPTGLPSVRKSQMNRCEPFVAISGRGGIAQRGSTVIFFGSIGVSLSSLVTFRTTSPLSLTISIETDLAPLAK